MTVADNLHSFLTTRSERVYLVGGTVRDMLLRRETHDLDVSVQGSASRMARAFADENGAAYFLMDATFDVARVILERDGKREVVDFVRLRGESIEQDLATRDFTINALAVEGAGWDGDASAVIDPFYGLADIAAQRVRAVSEDVFVNDPVRLLRAVRMEAELNFVLDEATEHLVLRDAALIENAPPERVRDELMKIIGAPNVLRNLNRLDTLDLLGRVLSELNALRAVTQPSPHVYDVFEHTLRAVAAAQETERAGYLDIAQGAFGSQLSQHLAKFTAGGRTRRELLRLALLLHDIGKPATRSVEENGRIRFLGHEIVGAEIAEQVLRRLKFSNEECALVKTIVANHMRLLHTQHGISNRAIYRFFRDTGDAGVDIAVHAWCDRRATNGDDADTDDRAALDAVIGRLLDSYFNAHARVVAPRTLVNGDEIMKLLRLPPGPRIGALLDAAREAQALGEVTTREEALAYIARLSDQKFDPRG